MAKDDWLGRTMAWSCIFMDNEKEFFIDDLKCMLNNKACNFIAFAITPLQSHGVDAAIYYLREKGIDPNGYIYILPHVTTGRCLNKDSFVSISQTIKVVNGCNKFSYNRTKKEIFTERVALLKYFSNKERKTIYVIWTEVLPSVLSIVLQLGYNCIFIIIDDGSGSYTNSFLNGFQTAILCENHSKISTKIKTAFRELINRLFISLMTRKLKKKGQLTDFCIFVYKKRYFEKNELAVRYYKRALKRQLKMETPIEFKEFSKSILINTQCLFESNMTNGIVDLELYKDAVKIVKKYNEKILVKPHPREMNIRKYEDIGCDLIKEMEYSQEVILSNLKEMPLCIISVFSSTLLNATGLFGVPAISLAKLMLRKNISKNMVGVLKKYIRQYDNIILFPDSWEELENLIMYCELIYRI